MTLVFSPTNAMRDLNEPRQRKATLALSNHPLPTPLNLQDPFPGAIRYGMCECGLGEACFYTRLFSNCKTVPPSGAPKARARTLLIAPVVVKSTAPDRTNLLKCARRFDPCPNPNVRSEIPNRTCRISLRCQSRYSNISTSTGCSESLRLPLSISCS
jgi:hypothetical protein